MKNAILPLLLSLLLACAPNQFDLVISNVNLIDGTGGPLQTNVSIGIRDGKIAVIDSVLTEHAENIIDGKGKFLIPGLFDCHVHTNNFERDFPKFIHYGVT